MSELDLMLNKYRQSLGARMPIKVYFLTWCHFFIYLLVFLTCYGFFLFGDGIALTLALSIPFGWSWFMLIMIGHDCGHHSFSASERINQLVGFLTLDCIIFSNKTWQDGHNVVHHRHPKSSEDLMFLRGPSIFQEIRDTASLALAYNLRDVRELLRFKLTRPWLVTSIGVLIRLVFLASLSPWALISSFLFAVISANYLGFLPHSLAEKESSDEWSINQLRKTWDFFPHSKLLASLIFGGLNCHATHHIFPDLPRSIQSSAADFLKIQFGCEYRSIDTIGALFNLLGNRHRLKFVAANQEVSTPSNGNL